MLKLFVLFAAIMTSMFVNMQNAEAAPNFKWYNDGTCGMVTPNGNLIYKVDISYCVKQHGAGYKWYNDGTCGYMTSKDDLIYKVDINYCVKEKGAGYKWYNDGSCGYMTSKNDLIYKVDISYCASELGTSYKWYDDGTCGYMTSKDDLIYKVDIQYCLIMDEKASSPLVSVDTSSRSPGKDFSRAPSVVEAYGRAKAGKQ